MTDNHFFTACEQEKLHLSGAIQSQGALIVANSGGFITHVSTNIESFVSNIRPGEYLPHWLQTASETINKEKPGEYKLLSISEHFFHGELLITISFKGAVLYEFFPLKQENIAPSFSSEILQINRHAELHSLQAKLVQYIHQNCHFERTIYYQFLSNGDGSVICEERNSSDIGSYLGLRFPASDIPMIARTLYVQNPWRIIFNAKASTSPLVGVSKTPPDLTFATLRSVSPQHVIYMQNMGVESSISFPIILNRQLDGLITCHHAENTNPSIQTLERMSQLVKRYNQQYSTFISQQKMKMLDNLERWVGDARLYFYSMITDTQQWQSLADWLSEAFQADGILLDINGYRWQSGGQPSFQQIDMIVNYFSKEETTIWHEPALQKFFSSTYFSDVAGVLAIKNALFQDVCIQLFLFRKESVEEITWGGNPNKPVNFHDGHLGISPRKSFEKWIEKTLGHSSVWSDEQLLKASKIRELLQEVADNV